MLNLGDSPNKACIAVIPQNDKYAVLGDGYRDGSDMDYEGDASHFASQAVKCIC